MGRYPSEEETPGLRVLSAEPHLIVGCVDARRIDLDHDLAGAGCWIRCLAVAQHFRPAVLRQQHCLHSQSSTVCPARYERRTQRTARRVNAYHVWTADALIPILLGRLNPA